MHRAVFPRGDPVFFFEFIVEEAAVFIAYGMDDGFHGKLGFGKQVRCLGELLLGQQVFEILCGILFQRKFPPCRWLSGTDIFQDPSADFQRRSAADCFDSDGCRRL